MMKCTTFVSHGNSQYPSQTSFCKTRKSESKVRLRFYTTRRRDEQLRLLCPHLLGLVK